VASKVPAPEANAPGSDVPRTISGSVVGRTGPVTSAAWSPDGQRILVASEDGTAWITSAGGHGEPIVFRGHEGAVLAATWSPDGQRIVTASADKTARIWSVDGGLA
jgi:WD40 repeat protein